MRLEATAVLFGLCEASGPLCAEVREVVRGVPAMRRRRLGRLRSADEAPPEKAAQKGQAPGALGRRGDSGTGCGRQLHAPPASDHAISSNEAAPPSAQEEQAPPADYDYSKSEYQHHGYRCRRRAVRVHGCRVSVRLHACRRSTQGPFRLTPFCPSRGRG